MVNLPPRLPGLYSIKKMENKKREEINAKDQ